MTNNFNICCKSFNIHSTKFQYLFRAKWSKYEPYQYKQQHTGSAELSVAASYEELVTSHCCWTSLYLSNVQCRLPTRNITVNIHPSLLT